MIQLAVAPQLLVCPRCRHPLRGGDGFACAGCDAVYPVIAGIADFRVAPDPWIGLEDDRRKARRLEAETAGMSFAEAVRAYWAMTPTTAPGRAAGFVDHVLKAEGRTREWLAAVVAERGGGSGGPCLDLGCGTGDLAAALAGSGRPTVGIDIALRWLVIARKRPGVAGRVALICCCAERLPFADASFVEVLSLGLLEHTRDAGPIVAEARRVLRPGGSIRLRTVNRYSLLPEPHVGVWGVGFVPRAWSDRLVRWRTGEGYLHHRPLSPRELRRSLAGAGLERSSVEAAYLLDSDRDRLGPRLALLARAYGRLRAAPLVGRAVKWVAPQLEASGTRATEPERPRKRAALRRVASPTTFADS